jgi:branched-chain amino acid transport system ATP-binding protein
MSGGARLEGRGITRRYGGLTAVSNVDIVAEPGVVTALIGPNGAGKTTLFACLSGFERPDDGVVAFDGREITDVPPAARARLGIGRTFQRIAVFPTMTVEDNLRVGAQTRGRWHGVLGRGRRDDEARVEQVLEQLGLLRQRRVRAGSLPTGTLRLIELGRALCGDPKVLLLDEPGSGLDSEETVGLQRVLRSVAEDGVAVLLVEHDMELVFDVADVVCAMAEGAVIATGSADEVRRSPVVQAAYLDPAGTG